MTIRTEIEGFTIDVERKNIKHAHLAVYPPDAHIHLSLPNEWTDEEARVFVLSKAAWLETQQRELKAHERQQRRIYTSGEVHYVLGQKMELSVQVTDSTPHCSYDGRTLFLFVKPGTTRNRRAELVREWMREVLLNYLISAVPTWMKRVGETDVTWEVKQMRARWGSCLESKRHLIFNWELSRIPKSCIEYVILHELTHLKVHRHNDVFHAQICKYMPDWKSRIATMNNFISQPFEENEFRRK